MTQTYVNERTGKRLFIGKWFSEKSFRILKSFFPNKSHAHLFKF